MKKLYLLATLAMVAFSGIAGNEDMNKSLKKSLPIKKELSNKLKASDFKVQDLAAMKKSVLKQVEDQKKAEEQKELEQKSTASAKHLFKNQNAPVKLAGAPEVQFDFSSAKRAASNSSALYAPTVDEHGIITNPGEGETKFYSRSGGGYYKEDNSLYIHHDQSSFGLMEVVEATDGTIYFKDIVSGLDLDVWVKGTKSGNQILVPIDQPVFYNSTNGATFSIRWGLRDGNTLKYNEDQPENFVFVVDGETLTLQGTSETGVFMGVYARESNAFLGYGDFETVYTEMEPKSRDLVELPEGVTAEPWTITTLSSDTVISTVLGKVAIDFLDVYVQGLFESFPEAWVKGTLLGDKVIFDEYQYLGTYNSAYYGTYEA